MNLRKKMNCFRAGFMLALALLLWSPLQESASSGTDAGPSVKVMSGKVLETMNSGGYTYVLLSDGEGKTWVALPQTTVVEGSTISCKPGMMMSNFTSTSLNRTFASIVFSAGLASGGSVVAPVPTPTTTAPAVKEMKVSKDINAETYTIVEIYNKKDVLVNKPVAIEGKVVKISRAILGKNWLHLQDGTGSQAAGTNDLVVTTDSVPEVDDMVTIKGNLSLDRDFGGGYFYAVIVEGAEVTGRK
jgi:hypothetical protein